MRARAGRARRGRRGRRGSRDRRGRTGPRARREPTTHLDGNFLTVFLGWSLLRLFFGCTASTRIAEAADGVGLGRPSLRRCRGAPVGRPFGRPTSPRPVSPTPGMNGPFLTPSLGWSFVRGPQDGVFDRGGVAFLYFHEDRTALTAG